MTHQDALPTATLEILRARAAIVRGVREFFEDHGYLEVDTPLLSQDTVVDAHIDPFCVPTDRGLRYLQTSPEFAMKRLLAGGLTSVFQIAHAFRRGEAGVRHNPEFTILEWYQVGTTYHGQMSLTEQLVSGILGHTIDYGRLSYDAAFERAIGCRVLQQSTADLIRTAGEHNVALPDGDATDRDDCLNAILADCVEPTLGTPVPEFVYDYPPTQAALAAVRDEAVPVAERFELYLDGIELCNGYQELTDADELSRRIEYENKRRRVRCVEQLPPDSRLLTVMRNGQLPACSGVALGLDRLIAIRLGLDTIREVIAFPFDRA